MKRKGFTLIELLVVIAIIGLIATLAVASFGSARQKANDAKRVADVRAIISALAAAAQDGKVICKKAGGDCSGDKISDCVLAVSCTAPVTPDTTYINIGNVKDPVNTAACASNPPGAGEKCDYTFYAGGSITAFNIGFTTQSATVQGLNPGTAHIANQTGLVN
ncbi:type II secretion system GspH family protein [Patescibacteria group bacterium]|nr:type II secretion system GspH family protein [Patescibacteria group bacterium]